MPKKKVEIPCSIPGCKRRAICKGLCSACYGRRWRGNDNRDKSLNSELERVKELYENSTNLDARMRWKKEIDRIEKEKKETEKGIKKALDLLSEAMREDDDYAWGWHCNIAMAFVDAGGDEAIANKASALFMKNCFGVDVKKFSQWNHAGS